MIIARSVNFPTHSVEILFDIPRKWEDFQTIGNCNHRFITLFTYNDADDIAKLAADFHKNELRVPSAMKQIMSDMINPLNLGCGT